MPPRLPPPEEPAAASSLWHDLRVAGTLYGVALWVVLAMRWVLKRAEV